MIWSPDDKVLAPVISEWEPGCRGKQVPWQSAHQHVLTLPALQGAGYLPQTCSHHKFWKTTMTSWFFLTRRKMVLIVQPRIAVNMKEAWFCISSRLRCHFMFYWRKNACPVKHLGITLYVALEILRMVLKCRSCIFRLFCVGPAAQWALFSCADCAQISVFYSREC